MKYVYVPLSNKGMRVHTFYPKVGEGLNEKDKTLE